MKYGVFFILSLILSLCIWGLAIYHYINNRVDKSKKGLLVLGTAEILAVVAGIICYFSLDTSRAVYYLCGVIFVISAIADCLARNVHE